MTTKNKTTENADRDSDLSAAPCSGHVLLTPKTCNCNRDDGRCPVCDWGLSVCAICGAAESQLDNECEKCEGTGKLRNNTWGNGVGTLDKIDCNECGGHGVVYFQNTEK